MIALVEAICILVATDFILSVLLGGCLVIIWFDSMERRWFDDD